MNTPDTVVVVGGGLAGAHAAFALREHAFAGRVVIVGEEAEPPYERPPLSKAYLRGEKPLADAHVRPPADYAPAGIELLAGRRAVTLDPRRSRIGIDDGTELHYDALLIATGAAPRALGATRAYLPGVHTLRTAADADAIRAAAATSGRVVVIGGGWIGSEVAASLRQLRHAVTLVTNLPRPLERVLGPEVAEAFRTVHAANGVRLVTGRVAAIEGDGRVTGVRLTGGRHVAADVVVVGVGARPRIELARRGGLDIHDGAITVDELLRTSAPNVFAAGDVAAAWHPRYERHLRVEHWDNAIRQGKAAAVSILGGRKPYARTPYFFSDQFDLSVEYRGYAPAWERVVVRGSLDAPAFHAFWLAGGRVVAAMNANLSGDGKALRQLVQSGEPVDPDRLADPTIPLSEAA